MAIYVTRHGANAGAVDVAAAINLNQAGAVQAVQVPAGVSAIKEVNVTLSASIVAVASAGVTNEIVLSGQGMATEQHITVGALREDTTSTGGLHIAAPYSKKVDMPVISGNVIDINHFMHGVDPGTPQIDVELVFA